MSNGCWAPTVFHDCVKYVSGKRTVVWIDTGTRTFAYAINSTDMSKSAPWPDGMDLEEVKQLAYATWRLS